LDHAAIGRYSRCARRPPDRARDDGARRSLARGLKAGVWPKAKDFAKKWALNRRFEPAMGDKERRAKIKGWRDAVRRTLSSG
jgi:glycerol kinase